MKNQTITKDGLKEIYDIACGNWKSKIEDYAKRNPFEDKITFTQVEVDEMINTIIFILGMTLAQVKSTCPRPLVQVYESRKDYYACDDGKHSTVLALDDKDRLVGIFDLKWYVQFGQVKEQGR